MTKYNFFFFISSIHVFLLFLIIQKVLFNEFFEWKFSIEENYFILLSILFINYQLLFTIFSFGEWVSVQSSLKIRNMLRKQLFEKQLTSNLHNKCKNNLFFSRLNK